MVTFQVTVERMRRSQGNQLLIRWEREVQVDVRSTGYNECARLQAPIAMRAMQALQAVA